MTPRSRPPKWGPEYQAPPSIRGLVQKAWFAVVLFLAFGYQSNTVVGLAVLVGIARVLFMLVRVGRHAASWAGISLGKPTSADPLNGVLARSAAHGGVYLGVDQRRRWCWARRERAVLVLGPPRSGKSGAVMIPALLAHAGPAVSTSTKPDVMNATLSSRCRSGMVWEFDPTGQSEMPAGAQLRWSPVSAAVSWDGALMIARAMVTSARIGTGTTDQTHWSRRAAALLAPFLHAAAISGKNIGHVVDWVFCHEIDEPGMLLQQAGAERACGVLIGAQNTEARERSSIFSAAADALDAYTSQTALAAATDPNFDAQRFVRSRETIYIHAPAEDQALAAPLVCGLLAEIRAATYRTHHQGKLAARVLFALDEAANIAPMAELPAIAAEGGGQGLTLLAAFQDLSQARARWGPAADGFITLFGAKLILPGVADSQTLETISIALGEYDRRTVTETHNPSGSLFPANSRTVSTHRERVLPPGDIANIPTGHGLYLDGLAWQLLTLTPAHQTEPWRTLTSTPPWITLQTGANGDDRAQNRGAQR